MGISRRRVALAALILGLVACGVAGCGGAAGTSSTTRSASVPSGSGPTGNAGGAAFAWLHPQAPPASWKVAAIPGGAAMAYPTDWKPQHGDAGTATAALIGAGDQTLGYLNLTPRQGSETLADWSSFRVDHNAEEGDKDVKRLAVGTNLRFRDGRGTCVMDSYTTITHARYDEIACLVAGQHGEAVIVAAAPPKAWASESPTLERAIEGVTT
jgi:hypothetical protein